MPSMEKKSYLIQNITVYIDRASMARPTKGSPSEWFQDGGTAELTNRVRVPLTEVAKELEDIKEVDGQSN